MINKHVPLFQLYARSERMNAVRAGYLYRRFPRDVGHQEVHSDVLAVHMSIHPVLNVTRHLVRVQIIKVLQDKRDTTGSFNFIKK